MKHELPFKAVYFVGIKGVGMTALAIVAKEAGCAVFGSDVPEEFVTDEHLKKHSIKILSGFSPSHISHTLSSYKPEEVLVVVTGAHQGMKNLEALAAKKLKYKTITHGEALGLFMEGKKQISVAGSHGKTTTAAMIAHILVKARLDPSFAVGAGSISSLKTAGHAGNGDYFVAEADEYVSDPQSDKTPRFLHQKPTIAVITTIDFDHPDVFSSIDDVRSAFVSFASKTDPKGTVIAGVDDREVLKALLQINAHKITYGISELADARITTISTNNQKSTFDVVIKGKKVCSITLSVPGFHNVQNATAALLAAHEAGVSWKDSEKALATFSGSQRRFEFIAEKNGIKLFDDYAHHPREIEATLKAAKGWFPHSRVIVLFQPHTYSRTKALFNDFITSFSSADIIGIVDIFASAREKKDKTMSSQKLVDELVKQNPHTFYIKNPKDFATKIGSLLGQNDILLTMGAGDIYTWHKEIIKAIHQKSK